jgi:N-acetyl-anhydromuramyl-L-alanine amidase AmpD
MPIAVDNWTYRSPNYNSRPSGVRPSSILIHTTEGSFDSDCEWMCAESSGVSTHYAIAPYGGVFCLVDDDKRAWHAGSGNWHGCTDLNDISLGIECSHLQGSAWPAALMDALDELCRDKIAQYGITQEWVTAHRWYAPGRKIDPTDFPDEQLKPFIANFYSVPLETYDRRYRVRYNRSVVRQGPSTGFPVVGYVDAGREFSADSIKFGEEIQGDDQWIHASSGVGFLSNTAAERIS